VGLGVQGLHDVYMMLKLPFTSPEAADLNERIFATIYYAAIEASCDLAKEFGAYETFAGSPASQGLLQYDLWNVKPYESPDLHWTALKSRIAKYGLRNSLSVALMPTASTAQVMGNTEGVEPVTSLLYVRRTLAGEFTVLNKHLVSALLDLDLWTPALKDAIICDNGSIQNISEIPQDIKDVFATAFDMSAKHIVDQAAARGPYVCQTQSMNVFMAQPTFSKITSMLFYAHKKGLKTGLYYLRTRPASSAKMITVEKQDECLNCSS
jgi:ribonucleotide reductase alpha subunit